MTGTRDLAILTGGNREMSLQRNRDSGISETVLNGVDRPARLLRACFSLFHSLALTSISLNQRPLLYEIRGGSL